MSFMETAIVEHGGFPEGISVSLKNLGLRKQRLAP